MYRCKVSSKFNHYNLPLLTDYKLYAEKGVAKFSGDIERLNIDLNTDLSGKDIPKGQYTRFDAYQFGSST